MNTRKLLRWLLVLPTIITTVLCIIQYNLISINREELMMDDLKERETDIRMVSGFINHHMSQFGGMHESQESLETFIVMSLEVMDSGVYSYKAVFDSDLRLVAQPVLNISTPIIPSAYPEYLKEVLRSEEGFLLLPYPSLGGGQHNVYVFFHWTETMDQLDRYLVTAAVIDQEIYRQVHDGIFNVIVGITVVIAIMNIIIVAIVADEDDPPPPYRDSSSEEWNV